jgi:hypothetical protein
MSDRPIVAAPRAFITSDGVALASVHLVTALAQGDAAAIRPLFAGHPDIDDPAAGRRVGAGVDELAEHWFPVSNATASAITLEHFTRSGAQAAAEIALTLDRTDGETRVLRAVVVTAFDAAEKLIEARIYYRRAWIDDQQHVRQRILRPVQDHYEFNETVQRYQDALRSGELDKMVSAFDENAYLDGHGQSRELADGLGMGLYEGRDDVRYCLKQMFEIEGHGEEAVDDGPSVGEYLQHVNMFEDETTTVLEFVIIRPNDPFSPEQAGVAAYERAANGLLAASRIYDEGW